MKKTFLLSLMAIGISMQANPTLTLVNWQDAIASATPDPAVGIKFAKLTGDETFSLYVTQLPAHSKIGAHYHTYGIETYQIVTGSGIMHTAYLDEQSIPAWNIPTRVYEGNVFTIYPGMIHQLENDTDNPLVLIFGCPSNHLSSDRVIIKL